jgi:hypothetical protein
MPGSSMHRLSVRGDATPSKRVNVLHQVRDAERNVSRPQKKTQSSMPAMLSGSRAWAYEHVRDAV